MALSYLQVGAIVPGDVGTITLAEHRNLLLNVLNFILSLLQIDDLDSNHLLGAVVDPFIHFTKRSFADPLQLGEQLLRIHPGVLNQRAEMGKVHEVPRQPAERHAYPHSSSPYLCIYYVLFNSPETHVFYKVSTC